MKSGETGIFLDFGMNFGSVGRYYAEFLKPRVSGKGLNDLIMMGLTPALSGLYREDAYLTGGIPEGPPVKVDAVFLSHAHADHASYVGLIDPGIPVYCSPVTAAMIKATQDSANATLEGETVIFSPRVLNPKTDEPLLLKENSYAYFWRKYVNVFNIAPSEKFQLYWTENLVSETNKSKKNYDYLPIDMKIGTGIVGEIAYEAIPVDHSVYGATAYVYKVNGKTICYTGDFRLHGLRGETSLQFKERLKEIKPDYLLTEGTNFGGKKGNDLANAQRASEQDVYDNCLKATQKEQGNLVIADFGPRNIERLLTFLRIAGETNRKLAVTTKDLLFLQAMGTADEIIEGAAHDERLSVYRPPKVKPAPWEIYGIDACGCGSVTAADLEKNPGNYILAFSVFDFNNLVDIAPVGGAYIYSTCEAFNEEMEIDADRILNWIVRFSMTPYGIKEGIDEETGKPKAAFERGYHASGHISEQELIDFVDYVSPGAIIPIHTEHPNRFQEILGDRHKVIIPEPGQPITL